MGMLDNFNKQSLRKQHKETRLKMNQKNKHKKDRKIFEQVIKTESFNRSDVVLTYVSTDIEVNTHDIIKYSIKLGKKVAVPLSDKKTFQMSFYFINSIKNLKLGNFSILEPDINSAKLCDCSKLKNSICIVPGLVFDTNGYRIGYGKGYYDRFLNKFNGISMGLCYNYDLLPIIPHDRHDVPLDIIITENDIIALREE